GDGQTATGAFVSHVYANPGSYQVSVLISDDDTQVSVPTSGSPYIVEVQDAPPVVDAGGPYVIDEGSPLVLVAQVTDPGNETPGGLQVRWELVLRDRVGLLSTQASATIPWSQLRTLGIDR